MTITPTIISAGTRSGRWVSKLLPYAIGAGALTGLLAGFAFVIVRIAKRKKAMVQSTKRRKRGHATLVTLDR
jgi:hypothetical protein